MIHIRKSYIYIIITSLTATGLENFITRWSSAQVRKTNQMLEMTNKGIEDTKGKTFIFPYMNPMCLLHLGYSGML